MRRRFDAEDAEIYQVEKILDHRITPQGKKEMLVKWAYYGPESNSWEPLENLDGSQEVLSDYWHTLAINQTFKAGKPKYSRMRKG